MVLPSSLPLRPYQQSDVDAITTAWLGGERPTGTGVANRVGVEIATGLGKTVEFAHLCLLWLSGALATLLGLTRPPGRVLVVVHRDELAQQAKDKIHSVAPHLRVGIVMADRNEVHADVIIASVQTIGPGCRRQQEDRLTERERRRGIRADDIRGVGMIIVDEAHHAAAPTWRAVLRHFGAYDGVFTAGFTATMERDDNLGLGEVWQEVVSKRDALWGIRNGFLCDVRGIRVQVPDLDLNGVHVRAGDLQQEETAQAMLDANTGEAIAKAVSEFAPDRRGPLFAPNVATCWDFAEALNSAGHPAEVVIGTTPLPERRSIYERLRTGVTRWLVNAMVCTEGWDAPWADGVIVARPTKSSALYKQMVGRGLRLWPAGGKTDALVLDVVGVTTKHHLASMMDLSPDRPVRERQSILEAWDEFDEIDWDTEQDYGTERDPFRVTKVIGTDVDLLAAGTPSPWLQTRVGTWFIPAGDLIFFLWPEYEAGPTEYSPTGLVTVGLTSADRFERSTMLRTGLTFEMGMTWAEALAAEHRKPMTTKQRAAPPTQTLIRDARKLGIMHALPSGMPAGPLFDDVWTTKASRRLDR